MLPIGPNKTPTPLYNPDLKDFEFYHATEDNRRKKYILPAQEIITLPKYLADHGARKLADYLVWKRGIKTNYYDEFEKVLQEIYVIL